MMCCVSFLFLIFQILHGIQGYREGLGCRDENNELVDWYYLYKLPEIDNFEGLEYVYITSNSKDVTWSKSDLKVNDPKSIPGRTISPLYDDKNENENVVLMYNDEPPSSNTDMVKGHTKGVIASDANTGFWLIHSVPHFPPDLSDGKYDYPHSARRYGQSFLCVTMTSDQINNAGLQLIYNEPVIYSSRAPNHLNHIFPNIWKVIQNDTMQSTPFTHTEDLKSIDGTVFMSFAKTRHFNRDLYEDLVAPTLNTALYVETWQHGTGNLPSDCSTENSVLNVEKVNIEVSSCEFSTMHDHSKWAVSSNQEESWICVGDINRQEHQKVRGGGTVCQKNPSVANAFQKLVTEIQPCHKSSIFYRIFLLADRFKFK